MVKRAVIYARYSSNSQSEQSIEGQVHVINEFAKAYDYTIIDTYVDRAITGTTDNRESFQKMIKDSAGHGFEYIIVYKLDRFARNRYDSAMNKAILKKNGVKVISATENISDSPEGIILEGLLESMAEYYSAELAQKVNRGMRETREKRNFTGGTLPYGYDIVNKKYVINEFEASIINRIFTEYRDGKKMVEIADKLDKECIRNKFGRPFRANRIADMLRNKKYIGYYESHGVSYPGTVPAIVDKDLFDEVNLILSHNRECRSGTNYSAEIPFVLSGKMYCHCGGMLKGDSSLSKSGRVYHYYVCNNKEHKGAKGIRKELLEEQVFTSLINELKESGKIDTIVELVKENYNKELKSDSKVIELKKRLDDVNKQLNNYNKAIGMGIFNESTQESMNRLLIEKAALTKEITIEESLMEKPITEEEIRRHLEKFLEYSSDTNPNRLYLFSKLLHKGIVLDSSNKYIDLICEGTNKVLKSKKSCTYDELYTQNGVGDNKKTHTIELNGVGLHSKWCS